MKIYYTNDNKKQGFSLIELAVLLVIIGALTGAAISMVSSSIDTAQYTGTKNKMTEIMNALHRFYAANGRLPCPASGAKTLGDSGYGTEIYSGLCDGAVTPANTAAPAGTVVTEVVAASGNWVRQGTLPTITLGLPDQFMYDDYGSKFTYIVTEKFTTNAVNGIITINDGVLPASPIATNVAVAVISHGKDRKGAYTVGTNIGIACNSVGYDKENCNSDANDVILTDTQYNDLAAASWFDDLIRWEDKNKVIGLTSVANGVYSNNATLSIKFTAATYNGILGGISGANTKCDTEYKGYHICDQTTDLDVYGRIGRLPKAVNAATSGWSNFGTGYCSSWTSTSGPVWLLSFSTTLLIPNLTPSSCATPKKIACCKVN